MKPICARCPFNLTPQKAMEIGSGRRQAGEGFCADPAAAPAFRLLTAPKPCAGSQDRQHGGVCPPLPFPTSDQIALLSSTCCWGYVFIIKARRSHCDTWHPLLYPAPCT